MSACFGRLIDQDGGADAALAAAAAPPHRARAEIARVRSEAMAADPTAARTAAESLVRMAAAGIADGGIAVLALQALGDAAALEPALAAVGLLAADIHGEAADGTDLLSMAAEPLRGALTAGRNLSPPLRKVLEDRGVDPGRLGEIDAVALARLGTLLEGGQRQLVALTVSLPARAEWAGFVRWLGHRLPPVSAQAATLAGIDSVALLAVTAEPPAELRTDILEAHPALAFAEVRPLVDNASEHPWAPPAVAGAGAGDAADNQVRVPVEILDRLFGRIGEFFSISSAFNVLVVDSQVPAVLQRLSDHATLKDRRCCPSSTSCSANRSICRRSRPMFTVWSA